MENTCQNTLKYLYRYISTTYKIACQQIAALAPAGLESRIWARYEQRHTASSEWVDELPLANESITKYLWGPLRWEHAKSPKGDEAQ